MIEYEKPQLVTSPKDCYFYHTVDLPDLGTIKGDWDLRPVAKDYTGRLDYRGKRVLDIGTATGFLSFSVESWGADVVSFDQSDSHPWTMLLGWKIGPGGVEIMRRGYWFCHRLIGSKAKVFYGDVFNIPKELGVFDVALVGSILLHVEHPFAVLRSAAELAKTIVVVDMTREGCDQNSITFRPCYHKDNPAKDFLVWWNIGPGAVYRMLESLGYTVNQPYWFHESAPDGTRTTRVYCIVGHRK